MAGNVESSGKDNQAEARTYEPGEIELKWQRVWREREVFRAVENDAKKKFYVLEMFPYPSGRIHMGHVRNYSIGDVMARVKRMEGYQVLYPMGWDAFGLPAENAALAAKIHPRDWTLSNIEAMRGQLQRMGFSYDWDREIATCEPDYFRWEQDLFLDMYEKGLVFRKGSFVNWCPSCNTVLANEQVEAGACWRCGTQVIQKELEQWFFKITAYAEELLAGLDDLKGGWPEQVLTMQRNWIGKSHGSMITFPLEKSVAGWDHIDVFTTRPDTLYGVTFMSIAAEHPLALELAKGTEREKEVTEFVFRVRNEDKTKRGAADYVKEGCFTGARVINPATGEPVPVYIANFVLMDYGTGAVMAVPAHDQRDFEFARKYGLPLKVVIQPEGEEDLDADGLEHAYEESGVMVNSGPFDGVPNEEGKAKVVELLAEKGQGKATVNYRLKDWGISRQRYWGAPIPMIHCPKCGVVPVPRDQLPVTLPEDVEIDYEGGSPLEKHPTWSKVTCPVCGGEARRETDTMDTFVESSWYFLRYCSPHYDKGMFEREKADYWMNVDQYIGGIEHAIMHLLYARFFTKVLRDLGKVGHSEPFAKLLTQGMVCMETVRCPEHGWLKPGDVTDGRCPHCGKEVVVGRSEKMSKSKKNVVDPERMIARYGADTVRLFILSDSPPERNLEWSDAGIEGAGRFLAKVWRVFWRLQGEVEFGPLDPSMSFGERATGLRRLTHKTIKKVTEDLTRRFHFNTAIAEIRVLFNALGQFVPETEDERAAAAEALEKGLLLLSPFTPHLAEELWVAMGRQGLVVQQPWPTFDEGLVVEETITMAVQVNGKLRARIQVAADADDETVKKAALEDDAVVRHTEGKTVRRIIVVKGRLVNIVVS